MLTGQLPCHRIWNSTPPWYPSFGSLPPPLTFRDFTTLSTVNSSSMVRRGFGAKNNDLFEMEYFLTVRMFDNPSS